MNAEELLRDLRERDVAVTVRGERLRVEAPRGMLTEELRGMLSEHKPEIVRFLHGHSWDEPTPSDAPDVEHVAAMRSSEFARSGLVLKAYSGELGCEVLFVSDDVADADVFKLGVAVHRASELKKILAWRPYRQGGMRVHQMKAILDVYRATVLEIRQAERRFHGDVDATA